MMDTNNSVEEQSRRGLSMGSTVPAERRGCVRDVAHTTKRLRYCDSNRLQHITPNGKTVANYVYGAEH